MGVYRRTPKWEVVIKRPDYTKSTLTYKSVKEWSKRSLNRVSRVVFTSSPENLDPESGYTDLISYEYEESIQNITNPFSLTLVPSQDKSGRTWKDKILSRDIVFIFEFGKIRYIGIVKNTGYSSNINNEKPNRAINITGMSLGGLLQTYNIPMNVYLWFDKGEDAGINNDKLSSALNSKANESQSLKGILDSISTHFLGIAFGSKRNGFKPIYDRFYSLEAQNILARYPMNIKPYQAEQNNLWDIFRQILPFPIYEMFGKYEDDKYKLICRETPFDTSEWNNLPMTKIDPLHLVSQNFSDTDDEVFTHYYSLVPNGLYSKNETYADSALNEVSIFDEERLSIYGYSQLEATFPFFDIDKGKDTSYKDFLKNNSARMYAWYKNNPEFQSGQIEMMTVPDRLGRYPGVGERIEYLRGSNYSIQFYVETVKRSMRYPEAMKSVYSVTRGYEYGVGSVTVDGITLSTPQLNKISQMGRKLIQAEQDKLKGINI